MLYNDSGNFQLPKLTTGQRRSLAVLVVAVLAGSAYYGYQIVQWNKTTPTDEKRALQESKPKADDSMIAADSGLAPAQDKESYVCMDTCAVITNQSNQATLFIDLELWNIVGQPLSNARIKIDAGSIKTSMGDGLTYRAVTDSLLYGDVDEKDHHGPSMPGKNFKFAIDAASPINANGNTVAIKFQAKLYMNGRPASHVEFAMCAKVRRLRLSEPGPIHPTLQTPPPTRAGTM